MSTITREFTKEQLQQIIETDHVQCGEASSLARIALASLEAVPVGEVSEQRDGLVMDGMVDLGGASTHRIIKGASKMKRLPLGTKFYTSQPAPVSVPEWTNEQCLEFLSIAFRHAEIKGDLELDDIRLGVKMVNGSHAAMLQGADGALTNEDTKQVGELVMWVKRLAHSLRKSNPDSKLQSDAMDYLSRKGLIGVEDILR